MAQVNKLYVMLHRQVDAVFWISRPRCVLDESACDFLQPSKFDSSAQGIRQIKKTDLNPVYLFISPPSMVALRDRLQGRGTEADAAIQKRLAMCLKEIEYAKEPNVHDIVIINDNLDAAYEIFKKVALGEKVTGDTLPPLDE